MRRASERSSPLPGKQRRQAVRTPDAAVLHALLRGPYHPPRVRLGQTLRCRIRGDVTVSAWSDGPIPWPIARKFGSGGKGPYIVCGDLVRAVQHESIESVRHWWGVARMTVYNWRRALGVVQFNAGTRALYRSWRPLKLPQGVPGERLLAISPKKLHAMRKASGLTVTEIVRRAGWASPTSFGQLASGKRRRATVKTLSRLAKAMGCRVKDLVKD